VTNRPHNHFCPRCCLGCSFRVWLRRCLVALLAAGVPLAVCLEFGFEFALLAFSPHPLDLVHLSGSRCHMPSPLCRFCCWLWVGWWKWHRCHFGDRSLLGSWRGWSAWLEWLWPPQHLQTCLCVVVFTCDITMDKQRMPVHIYFVKQTKFYRWFVGRHLCVLASAAQVAFFWAAYFAF